MQNHPAFRPQLARTFAGDVSLTPPPPSATLVTFHLALISCPGTVKMF